MASLIQLIGFIVISVGVWFIYPPAAIIVAGGLLVSFGLAWERVRNARSIT